MQKLSLGGGGPFGVMFHHFYSDSHPRGQGAISAEEFEAMINWLEDNFTILSPDEFIVGFEGNGLKNGQICLVMTPIKKQAKRLLKLNKKEVKIKNLSLDLDLHAVAKIKCIRNIH